jgi:predicted pyridoxine 5'-phosphate oxidase superfamily flavin-nucleotide-binding protein
MIILPPAVVEFFHKQNFVIVSTVGPNNVPHNACKGIVEIDRNGIVYILDLYRRKTLSNLKRNPNISITAVDEHRFMGYCLKGIATVIDKKWLNPSIVRAWEKRLAKRITRRLLKNIHEEEQKGHGRHPESILPKPEYMISMEVNEIVELVP